MLKEVDLVFLLDVDNTLLDNDRFLADLGARLADDFGAEQRDRYWALVEALRKELGYVDYLLAMQRFRQGLDEPPALLGMSAFMLEYPFAQNLYPQALATIAALSKHGTTVILSDGDIIFQPRKIQRSGVWAAVEGRVLIDVHKEQSLDQMQARFPARHYVMVDDKPRILTAMKEAMGEKLTTVFVRQGHYANATGGQIEPTPDIAVQNIADLLHLDRRDFLSGGSSSSKFGKDTQQELS